VLTEPGLGGGFSEPPIPPSPLKDLST